VTSRERRAAGRTSKKSSSGSFTPAALHAAGLRDFRAGRHLDAQICCERALALDPNHADALHLMGVLCFRAKQYDHSVEWLVRAIRQDPKPEYLSSLGTTLQQQGRHEEALKTFDKAVQLRPDDAELWRNLGHALAEAKRPLDAVLALQHALKLDPNNWDAADRCASLLRELGRLEEAVACLNLCGELQPGRALTLYVRGHTLVDLRRYEEALADLKKAHALDKNHPGICNSLGFVLQNLGRHAEALHAFDKAIALRSDYVEALNSKAASLAHLHRFLEALALVEQVRNLQPAYVPALVNSALWLSELRRFDEAFAAYALARVLDPGNADAEWNLSFLHLLTGNFEAGWAGREARWKAQARLTTSYPDFPEPRWHGTESVAGKTILIYAEEGFGDSLQFARYIPMVAALGARVILVVAAAVQALLSGVRGVSQCLTKPMAAMRPEFDFHCAISSLPLIFGTRLDSIPKGLSYLPPPPEDRLRAWEDRLGPRHGLRVGLVWSGSPGHKNDHNRSLPLRAFERILEAHDLRQPAEGPAIR
jgi:tetratricopeptide (TPR) repeat protein